jgi:hypothetical protein
MYIGPTTQAQLTSLDANRNMLSPSEYEAYKQDILATQARMQAGTGGLGSAQTVIAPTRDAPPLPTPNIGTNASTNNALADYINNQLYGGILDRRAETGATDFWANTAQREGWTQDQLRDEFAKAAAIELQGRPQGPFMPATPVPTTYQSAPVPQYTPYASTAAPAYTPYTSAAAPTLTPFQSEQFNFEADPGYAFRKQQGEEAMQKRQLASGNFFSGGALKEAADYGSGLASQEYGNAFQRYLSGDANAYRNNRGNNADAMTTWQANDSTGYRNNQGNFSNAMAGWQAGDAAGFRNNQANNAGELGRWAATDTSGFRNNQANFNNAMTLDNTGYSRALTADNTDYSRWVDDYNRNTTADNTNWDRLTYLDKAGLVATGSGISAGANSTNAISSLLNAGGNATAGGSINKSNAWTNAIGNALYSMR